MSFSLLKHTGWCGGYNRRETYFLDEDDTVKKIYSQNWNENNPSL